MEKAYAISLQTPMQLACEFTERHFTTIFFYGKIASGRNSGKEVDKMGLSTKVSIIMLLIALGLITPAHAFAQVQPESLPDDPSWTQPVEKVHHKHDFLYLASEAYLAGGTMADMKFTIDGLNHPPNAYTTSGKFLMQDTVRESGWASFVGSRNTFGVVSANVLLNTGFDLLDRRLYRRGGRWRMAAITLNVAKATGNWAAAFHNMGALGDLNRRVELQTGYHGTIVWRH